MKKTVIAIMVLVIAGTGFAANLVLNPSFENDVDLNSRPDNWGNDADYSRSSEQKVSGSYSAKGAGNGGIGSIKQTITLTPSTDYNMSVNMYYASGTGIVVFDTTDKFDPQGCQTTLYGPNGGWTLYESSFNSGTNTSVQLRTYTSDLTNGVFYIDDVILETAGGGPNLPPSWVANPTLKANGRDAVAYSGSLGADASDPDGDPLTFAKTGGAAWLSVASNGALSGTPSSTGTNTFTVTVSDGVNTPVGGTVEIIVDEPLPPWTGPTYGPAQFTIFDMQIDQPTSGDITLSWEAALNQTFAVYRSTDLSSWSMLTTNYPSGGADSGVVTYVDSSPPADQVFYRVSKPYDPQKRPNVLLLVIDDLRDHTEFDAANVIAMPNYDRLAAKGMKFESAHCQATFCNPSRASFISGLRPDTTEVTNNTDYFRESTNPDIANCITMPQCFRTNGYYTVSLGKILHGSQMDPLSWDLQNNNYTATSAGNSGTWVNMTTNYASPLSWCQWRANVCADNDMGDGMMAEHAIQILQTKRDDPFFLAVGFKKPHDPFEAPQTYFDMYPRESMNLHQDPVDADPINPLKKPGGNNYDAFDAMSDYDRVSFLRSYAAASTYIDAQIGKILDEMDNLGLWQNTIVLLWSDHGYHQGERGWWNKVMLDELDANVPFLAYVPEMPYSGVVCTNPVELVDVYPTLTELAGLDAPVTLDGGSFVSLITDPNSVWTDVALTQWTEVASKEARSVCDGRYRYTEFIDGSKELYDQSVDPLNWYNEVTNPAYSDVVTRLAPYVAAP